VSEGSVQISLQNWSHLDAKTKNPMYWLSRLFSKLKWYFMNAMFYVVLKNSVSIPFTAEDLNVISISAKISNQFCGSPSLK